MNTMTNHIKVSPHFHLYEFADHHDNELVVLNHKLVLALEDLRTALHLKSDHEYAIRITSGTRTLRSNNLLALRLGWTHLGGQVSQNSKHLPIFGGIAADITAFRISDNTWCPIPVLAASAVPFFDVIIPYLESHLHVDLRKLIEKRNAHAEPQTL